MYGVLLIERVLQYGISHTFIEQDESKFSLNIAYWSTLSINNTPYIWCLSKTNSLYANDIFLLWKLKKSKPIHWSQDQIFSIWYWTNFDLAWPLTKNDSSSFRSPVCIGVPSRYYRFAHIFLIRLPPSRQLLPLNLPSAYLGISFPPVYAPSNSK